MNAKKRSLTVAFRQLSFLILLVHGHSLHAQSFHDKSSDLNALPKVPDGFVVTEFAREPLVRQPCSMAFDDRGRLFVGMGPQYRNPTPETPGDSVVIFLDTNGDGQADETKIFATGFNAIQGLAWHGRDLWIANAPDLTIVCDFDGDDVADKYTRVYTDLGNLEHGLHGLTWAPDGKLYMSKGNSKGLSEPGRYAPKPFRDLWGVTVPGDAPDFPAPLVFSNKTYQRAYHDPEDDWGLDGGVLRCDDGGNNLEIVARGFRNPWDIAMDSAFNWLGTDNDQVGGDRVLMPFYAAHFGWNHGWSSHWNSEPHAPTAPVSGPLFEGSGTGIVFADSPQFPNEYRGVFFINDWLRKTTFLWRPQWDGALLKPAGGNWTPFIEGGNSLFRPTDLEFGPDGALWVLGWSSGYGAEWKDGELTNEGRIFRIAWKDAVADSSRKNDKALTEFTVAELFDDFNSPLPVRRINAQDELVRRAEAIQAPLLSRLQSGQLSEAQETWTAWALGRVLASRSDEIQELDRFLLSVANSEIPATLNLKIQCIRILGQQAKQHRLHPQVNSVYRTTLHHPEPRVRLATVQAIHEAKLKTLFPNLLDNLQQESDATVFYAAWQSLRSFASPADLRSLLADSRDGVRRAALLGLLENHSMELLQVKAVAENDSDAKVREIAKLWVEKASAGVEQIVRGNPLGSNVESTTASASSPIFGANVAVVRDVKSKSKATYQIVPSGMIVGKRVYSDRPYQLTDLSPELSGHDLVRTANDDDNARGEKFLSFEALLPVRILVGMDLRLKTVPTWLTQTFKPTELDAKIDEGAAFRFYEATFPAGRIELGGNTDDGIAGGKGNYIVAVTPVPLLSLEQRTTIDATVEVLAKADPQRGAVLFHHAGGASCAKCHSLDDTKNGFGPNLRTIGSRSNTRHIVQSIVEPSAIITEGFNQVNVLTDSGQVFNGVLLEESGLTLSLGLSTGERVDIPKTTIEHRVSSHSSAMPDMATTLTPGQVADLAAYLMMLREPTNDGPNGEQKASGFSCQQQADRLLISLDGNPITEFVFNDKQILRPYFSNLRLPNGLQVTRHHPPIEGVDATDHETMHPGLWLGFGDISGNDFWRNKARIEHVRFVTGPEVTDGRVTFATECRLLTQAGQPLCLLSNRFTLRSRPAGWSLTWDANIQADSQTIRFGDQEELGFGARVATPLTEKNGGRILSSSGLQTAQQTWGQPAMWCDYSGSSGSLKGGVTLMTSPMNFRESWWHNRDYGLFVANPFGREAMKQGEKSSIAVLKGQSLQLRFGALIHDGQGTDFAGEYKAFAERE